MPVTLGGPPLADFSKPLQMLEDCHHRIEHFLQVLEKVAAQFGGKELSDDARRALEVSLTYFAHAAPRHTADEEVSLFPRMRSCSDPDVKAALDELDRLEADHRHAEQMHARVDELGRRWLAAGSLTGDELSEFQHIVADLRSIYAAHIRLEEQRVFKVAAHALNSDDLKSIGEEMRRRRNLSQ